MLPGACADHPLFYLPHCRGRATACWRGTKRPGLPVRQAVSAQQFWQSHGAPNRKNFRDQEALQISNWRQSPSCSILVCGSALSARWLQQLSSILEVSDSSGDNQRKRKLILSLWVFELSIKFRVVFQVFAVIRTTLHNFIDHQKFPLNTMAWRIPSKKKKYFAAASCSHRMHLARNTVRIMKYLQSTQFLTILLAVVPIRIFKNII